MPTARPTKPMPTFPRHTLADLAAQIIVLFGKEKCN